MLMAIVPVDASGQYCQSLLCVDGNTASDVGCVVTGPDSHGFVSGEGCFSTYTIFMHQSSTANMRDGPVAILPD